MAKGKTPPHKVVMTEGKREIVRILLAEYDIRDAHDIQEALKRSSRQYHQGNDGSRNGRPSWL